MERTQSSRCRTSSFVIRASTITASLSPVMSDTELAGNVACREVSQLGKSLTTGLYGLTKTLRRIDMLLSSCVTRRRERPPPECKPQPSVGCNVEGSNGG